MTTEQLTNYKLITVDTKFTYDEFIHFCTNHPSLKWTDVPSDDFMKWRDAVEDNTCILPNCVTCKRLLYEIKLLAELIGADDAKESIIRTHNDF